MKIKKKRILKVSQTIKEKFVQQTTNKNLNKNHKNIYEIFELGKRN